MARKLYREVDFRVHLSVRERGPGAEPETNRTLAGYIRVAIREHWGLGRNLKITVTRLK